MRQQVKRLVFCALLTAIALTIFMIEAQLPALAPVPGIKLGLANIVTVYAMFALGPRDTLLILVSRVFLGSLFAGGSTFLYSLAGGLLCRSGRPVFAGPGGGAAEAGYLKGGEPLGLVRDNCPVRSRSDGGPSGNN